MYDVIISGGGPVGLGLAIDLGRRGHRVAVIERNVEPVRIPKGQNLTQRTMEHMQTWGVEADIRAAKTIPRGVGLGGLTAYGSLLSGYHYDWFKRAAVGQYYSAENERLPQYETEHVLRARIASLVSVELFAGWQTTGHAEHGDHVEVKITRDGETQDLQGTYLVGCDGSRSLVRKIAGITETKQEHDRLMVLNVFTSPEFFQLIQRFPDKQFYKILHPDLDGYWMFFGMVDWGKTFFFHAPVPADTNRDNFDFTALIHRAVGQVFALDLDYVGFWDLRISQADAYRAGRVFVAGDAAHSHPPYGGYGINTGFEDARNLGWKLSAMLQGWGGEALLDSYQAERHPVFASTADDFIDRFIRDDRAFVRAHDPARNKAGFEAAWAALAQEGADAGIAGYAPNYAGSPIIAGESAAKPSAKGTHSFAARPGFHLPPQTLSNGVTTTEMTGTGFLLLSTEAGSLPDPAAVPMRQAVLPPSTASTMQAAHVLVRPDGYVAWTSDDLGGLQDALAVSTGH